MGSSVSSSYPELDRNVKINRFPIISPRHIPIDVPYNQTPYSKFDPQNYADKFTFERKALPKYT